MKIFYAVQATGNGHMARAMELLPHLQHYGTVDIFLSGNNSDLPVDLPVKFRGKGLSLFYKGNGRLNYYRIFKELNLSQLYNQARQLPVEKYDVVINDFESITAQACRLKNVPSVNFGHQASFQSHKVPRPAKKDLLGELILKNYAIASAYIGLHFEQYDDFIFNPVIKQDIINATPNNHGHITVYLAHYADEIVIQHLKKITGVQFEVFSKQAKEKVTSGNTCLIPISNKAFNKSLVNCSGVMTGAGFETPAEALYLGKKLMCIPIRGQYEQQCNAAALKNFNVTIINSIGENFCSEVTQWINGPVPRKVLCPHSTTDITGHVISKALQVSKQDDNNKRYRVRNFSSEMLMRS